MGKCNLKGNGGKTALEERAIFKLIIGKRY